MAKQTVEVTVPDGFEIVGLPQMIWDDPPQKYMGFNVAIRKIEPHPVKLARKALATFGNTILSTDAVSQLTRLAEAVIADFEKGGGK
jgi:hypothetical protein